MTNQTITINAKYIDKSMLADVPESFIVNTPDRTACFELSRQFCELEDKTLTVTNEEYRQGYEIYNNAGHLVTVADWDNLVTLYA